MARLLDKVTKGFRDTPMKALIAKVTGPNKAAALASKAAYQVTVCDSLAVSLVAVQVLVESPATCMARHGGVCRPTHPRVV